MLTTTSRRPPYAARPSKDRGVTALRRGDRHRAAVLVGALALATLVALGMLSSPANFAILVAAIVVPAVLVLLWQRPVAGVYLLFGASVLLEAVGSAQSYPDDIGAYLPFFEDLATWTRVKGLSFSLAEMLMALVLLIYLLKGLATRKLRFDRGSLMLPLGLYMLMVLVSEAHGIGSGGDFRLSLWEVRAQVYMFVAYVLTCNLIKTRKQIDAVVVILVVGTALRGVQGIIRFVELHGHLSADGGALFSHEQSFFFNAFITLTAIFFLYGGPRRLKWFALALLPIVLVSNLANQRRAAILALAAGLLLLLLVTVIAHRPGRRVAVGVLLALAVIWPPYYAAFKNSTSIIGQAAHAVNSNSNPDPRDASSNLYRYNEDNDIVATMKSSTLSQVIGYGFGKTMLTPYPLADISGSYIFWNLLPHNSILWVWMRLGTVGYALFWVLIAAAILQAMRLSRRLDNPYLKGLAVFIMLMVVQEVIFGYLDLQWTNDRNLIVMGVLLALISRLALFARREEKGTTARPHGRAMLVAPHTASALRVVDGRLVKDAPAPAGSREEIYV